jgi:hypothetical protein
MPQLFRLITVVLLAVTLGNSSAQAGGQHNHGTHETDPAGAAFAQREREVMPFDLDATIHVFSKTERGGVQQVKVIDAGDTDNIALIRSHLKEERVRFSQGEFSDPAYLHGADMAGLATIQEAAAAGHLEVRYRPLPDGAELIYVAAEADVVAALHSWFEAQVADHGEHAVMDE